LSRHKGFFGLVGVGAGLLFIVLAYFYSTMPLWTPDSVPTLIFLGSISFMFLGIALGWVRVQRQ
jgi:hypothetical protein